MEWFCQLFTIYSTTRVVQIRSKFLAITYFTLVALVWFGILKSYQLDLRKTYQKRCPVMSTFTTKVKGVLSTDKLPEEEFVIKNTEKYRRLWDTQDLITTSETGFTVMSNVIITANQTRGVCPSTSTKCEKNENCTTGKSDKASDGIMTGNCAKPEGTCEVSAWCPTEEDVLPLGENYPLFHDAKNFTVLIKASVEFPDCEPEIVIHKTKPIYKRRNLLSNFTDNCRYDPVKHPFCPIFIIGDIVKWSDQNYTQVGITGGIFQIVINWNCEFDWGLTIDDCLPEYTFARIDVSESETVAPGFNWRGAVFFEGNKRTLTKHYGIKFIVVVHGEGRKFDFLLLVLTIGASIGLFSFAPLFCDFLFDLFCYLKTIRRCTNCFSDSFDKTIRYQRIEPSTLSPPRPPLPKNVSNSNLYDLGETELSNSLSYDTRL